MGARLTLGAITLLGDFFESLTGHASSEHGGNYFRRLWLRIYASFPWVAWGKSVRT